MDIDLLKKSYIFGGFSDTEISRALGYLDAREVFYKKGTVIIAQGEPINEFGMLMSGGVQVSCYDINGNRMIMAEVAAGGVFAESLAMTGAEESPVFAETIADTRLLWLCAEPIRRNTADNPLHAKIVANFAASISHKCLEMNDRIQILSKKTIREKVITYLSQLAERSNRREFDIAMDRQALANYLGAERSALSRELSKMAKEGIIAYNKNRFHIL